MLLIVKFNIFDIKKRIPLLHNSTIKKIDNSYPSDEKYLARFNDNNKYLLRLFDLKEYKSKLNFGF